MTIWEVDARFTFHLTPRMVWERQSGGLSYRPEAYDADGFIHCTDGEQNLLTVANAFYQRDQREQIVLVIAVDRIAADVRYEDAARIFPHIYGPLNTDAVVAVRSIERELDGRYFSISEARSVDRS